jgi:hypothetical protein
LTDASQRPGFLTQERLRAYPAISFAVLVALAIYDRIAGHGLVNAIDGALGGDFLSFYTGGTFVANGRPSELSSEASQLSFQLAVLGENVQGAAVWVSPPFFAWFFAPFSLLPYPIAYSLFVALSAAVLTVSFRALGRALGNDQSAGRMWWLSLQYYPTLQWLLNGQITGLWLSAFIAVFLLLRARRDGVAGLVLGLFACKPTLAVGLAVALLVARRFRTLLAASITAAVLVAIGLLTLPEAMRDYIRRGPALVSLVRSQGFHVVGLHGSFEFATLLFDGLSHRLASAVGAVVFTALVAATASPWFGVDWRPGSRSWDLRMAATFALGLIASPHLYGYDLMLLALPLFIVAASVPRTSDLPLDGGPLLRTTAMVWALGLVGPFLSLTQDYITRRVFGFAAIVQLGVLAVLAWGLTIRRIALNSA